MVATEKCQPELGCPGEVSNEAVSKKFLETRGLI